MVQYCIVYVFRAWNQMQWSYAGHELMSSSNEENRGSLERPKLVMILNPNVKITIKILIFLKIRGYNFSLS